MPPPTNKTVPDGGYGWVIVICSFLCGVTYSAQTSTSAVYIVELTSHFDASLTQISLLNSLNVISVVFIALPGSALISKYGCRAVILIGILTGTAGLAASAFASQFSFFVFCYAVIRGIGCGLMIVPCSVIVQQYFTQKRGIALGISVCGQGVGPMIFGPIHRLLINNFGWRGGLLLFAGINLQSAVFAALLRPINLKKSKQEMEKNTEDEIFANDTEHKEEEIQTVSERPMKSCCKGIVKAFDLTLLKDCAFVLFVLGRTFAVQGSVVYYNYAVTNAIELGVTKLKAAFVLTGMGIGSISGRLVAGFVTTLKCVNRQALFITVSISGGILCMFYTLAGGLYYTHLISGLIFGFLFGMADLVFQIVSSDMFGVNKLASCMAWQRVSMGMISFPFLIIVGILYDATGTFIASFLSAGALMVCGGLCQVLTCLILRHRKRQLAARPG